MHAITPVRRAVAISYGGGDQLFTTGIPYGVYIATAGNLVVRLSGDSADRTFSNMNAGQIYPLEVAAIRQTGSTAGGLALFA